MIAAPTMARAGHAGWWFPSMDRLVAKGAQRRALLAHVGGYAIDQPLHGRLECGDLFVERLLAIAR